ncbi:MAG: hypothetical protein ACRDBG_09520, partial [Waterburya sp.]
MKKKPEHLPIIIGVVMLFSVFLTTGGLIVYFVSSDTVQQYSEDSQDPENPNQENNQSEEEETEAESEMTVAP